MKIKKTFVAGALALAMGLSFVAPSFADEGDVTTPEDPTVEEPVEEQKTLGEEVEAYKADVKKVTDEYDELKAALDVEGVETTKAEVTEYLTENTELLGDEAVANFKASAEAITTAASGDESNEFKALFVEVYAAAQKADLAVVNEGVTDKLKAAVAASGLNETNVAKLNEAIDAVVVGENGAFDLDAVVTAYTTAKDEEENLAAKKAELEKDKATLVKLNDAVHENEVTAKAARIVLENYPKLANKFKEKLNALLADSDKVLAEAKLAVKKLEADIKKLEDDIEALEPAEEVGFFSNFVINAYADGETEVTPSIDYDKLIDDLNKNTQDIKDALGEAESNEPSTTDPSTKPSTEDPSTKPSTEKPSTEKPSTTKPEDKKPSTNAKTGIVGVAGVAAVLAAASGAYVSSKRK